MTQLVLILGINLAGLMLAIAMARWTLSGPSSTGEVRRLGNAVERASKAFLAGCFRQVALGFGLVGATLAVLHIYVWQTDTAPGGLRNLVWSLLGLLLGALLACVVAHFSAQLSQRASIAMLRALPVSSDRTLGISIRAGGSVGLLSECTAVLGVSLLFGLLTGLSGENSTPLDKGATYVLGGFALGAALAALLIQRGGSVYQSASEVGGELGGERDADLKQADPRNPVAIARLVGEHVGQTASSALDLFVCTSVANTVVLLVGARVFAKELQAGHLELLLLPVVVKSFGVVASGFGTFVVRTEEKSDPSHAVWRGHATTLVIGLGSLLGATFWLVGDERWPPFFVAGALGLLAAAAAAHASTKGLYRPVTSKRPFGDALKIGDSALLAEGLAAGSSAAVVPSLAVTVALLGSWHLGQESGVAAGGMLAVALSLMSMLASGPFMLAVNTLKPITEGAKGMIGVALGAQDIEVESRSSRLYEMSAISNALGRSFWILVGVVSALLSASFLVVAELPLNPEQGSEIAAGAPSNLLTWGDPAHPAIVYSGLLGAVLVVVYAGGVLRSAARCMRRVVLEIDRQLGGFPKERGKFRVPADYIPSYRACIEIVAHGALHRHMLPVLSAVLLPILLGPLLSAAVGAPGVVRAALASFVLAGAVTGLTAAFAAQAIHSYLGFLRRQIKGKPGSAESALEAGGFAQLCGAAAGPAAQLVLKTAAVGSLCVAPFLS